MQQTQGAIGTLKKDHKITIIGGGISGLFVAYHLKKQGIPFELHEKEEVLGGKIGTKVSPFGLSETAANAIFTNDDVFDLLDDLNLKYIPTEKKLKKMIWRKGKVASPPISVWEILKILPSLLKKPHVDEQTSVFDFFSPLLGKEVSSEVLAPVFGGVYAENIKDLHFKSIFKSWKNQRSYFSFIRSIIKEKKNQKRKSQSISFPGGMAELINALHDYLKDHIRLNSSIETLTSDNTLICTHAHHAAAILRVKHPKAAEILEKIHYNSLSSATLITEKEIPFLKGAFGLLFPPEKNAFHSLGILANSEIFPKRTLAPNHHSYTFILKGDSASTDDEVSHDLSLISAEASFKKKKSLLITHWATALPIYNYHRHQSILRLRSQFLQIEPGLCLFGNYVDGISLRDILGHAKKIARNSKTL